MADDDLHQPNDKLFRTTFGMPKNAAAFLNAALPSAVAGLVEWSELRLQHGSFVDSAFRSSHTDLLFSAPMSGHEAMIYVLFEHQSRQDPRLPLRLLRYMVRIWERAAESVPYPDRLPAILPVVLSQNAKAWHLNPRFEALLNLPDPLPAELGSCVPDFAFQHLQLATMEFDSIPGTPAGILVLRAMKAKQVGRLLDSAVWDEHLLHQLLPVHLHQLLFYILGADVDRSAFEAKIQNLSDPETRSIAMTLADRLRQQGHQQGQQKGMQLGRQLALQEAILRALETRFSSVPDGLRDTLAAVTEEESLHALLRAAFECHSMEAFAEVL